MNFINIILVLILHLNNLPQLFERLPFTNTDGFSLKLSISFPIIHYDLDYIDLRVPANKLERIVLCLKIFYSLEVGA